MSDDNAQESAVEEQEGVSDDALNAEQAVDDGAASETDVADEEGVLSEEELAALKETSEPSVQQEIGPGGCSLYDFRDPSRLLNGRLPGLDSVHEGFCNGMQQLLKTMLGRSVEVSAGETNLTRLGDYQRSLPMPTSIHGSVVQDRKHSRYLTADGRFVYACVDAFFGGMSGTIPQSLEREFSTSERRFMEMLIAGQFKELQSAWAPICALSFGEPKAIKAANLGGGRDDQIMVVSRFTTNLNPGEVEFHLVMPYALLDSLRPYLTAGPRSGDVSRNWRRRFAERLTNIDIETRSVFGGVRITFGELVSLAPGDFIPVSNQSKVVLMVDERPLYQAEPGISNGMAAAKVVAKVHVQ